jgi:phage tail-like protein
MSARSVDPALAFQFSVDFNADPFYAIPFIVPLRSYFTEVSGLDVEWEMAEYKTTNVLGLPHSNFVPLRPVYHPITLRRGITNREGFWLWHQILALGAKPLMRTWVTITLYDRSYEEVAVWNVERAWPSKVSGPQLRADSNDVLIEELTLTHGGISRGFVNPIFQAANIAAQMLLP